MTISAKDVDFFSTSFKKNSYDIYRQLRASQPVLAFELPSGLNAWLVTRHQEAQEIFKNPKVIKDYKNIDPDAGYFLENGAFLAENMLSSDPPDHTRTRRLVAKAFTPKMIAQMEEEIQKITDDLLSKVEGKAEMDVVSDFALPLPIEVISNMLGIPADDRHKFHEWSQMIVQAANDQTKMKENQESINAFVGYIRELIDVKRKNPDDRLISLLIAAHEEGDHLTEQELISNVFLLIVAGHETTVNLITNGLYALLKNPDQLKKLRENPDLLDNMIEESLRYHSPVEIAPVRYAAEDMDWDGQKISRGDAIFISLASVNRDEAVYEEGDAFDISRPNIKHFAFGKGIHFCLGAPLARMEAKVAFRTLLDSYDELTLADADDDIHWRPGMMMRSLEKLRIAFK